MVMVLGGGAFGKCSNREGGALMNGISALRKEAFKRLLRPPTTMSKCEVTCYETGRGLPPESDRDCAGASILDIGRQNREK